MREHKKNMQQIKRNDKKHNETDAADQIGNEKTTNGNKHTRKDKAITGKNRHEN